MGQSKETHTVLAGHLDGSALAMAVGGHVLSDGSGSIPFLSGDVNQHGLFHDGKRGDGLLGNGLALLRGLPPGIAVPTAFRTTGPTTFSPMRHGNSQLEIRALPS